MALTPEQWTAARRRWEGCDREGFDWLAKEVAAAFDTKISRQACSKMAAKQGWEKGGDPSKPLAPAVAQPGKSVAQPGAVVAQPPEVADEVVDAAPPASPAGKPPGYLGTGRPSKYRPEFDDLIVSYFDKDPFTEVNVEQPSGLVKLQRLPTDPPTLAQFAKTIGASVDAINAWATAVDGEGRPRYPSFAAAYARARELNESLVLRAGLLGLYDNRVAQFALKNLYGWQDAPKPDTKVAPVSRELLDKTYGERMRAAHERMAAVLEDRRKFLADL